MAGSNKSNTAFQSERRFRDPINFPYGFARSGEFTIQQAELIESHGMAYKAFALGERIPSGSDEEAFVAFCQGLKAAESIHERTWQRYLDKVQRAAKVISFTKGGPVHEDGTHLGREMQT